MNDAQLLQSFAGQKSEAAFRTLVERHLPLVFGTARRITGDNALAEDIAQTVFILLARKADKLGSHTLLSGWLYRTTRFVTSRALISEQRRRHREQEAVTMQSSPTSESSWLQAGPQLDDALAKLGDTDRNAILLRYFEQQSLRDVGLSLSLTEEAAKKRVTRALEKLCRIIGRRGVEISAVALAAGLASEAADAATILPLAGKISSVVIAQGTAGAGAAAGSILLTEVLAALRWAKILNIGAAVAIIIAATFIVPPTVNYVERTTKMAGAVAPAPAQISESKKPARAFAAGSSLGAGSTRRLLLTVLDAKTHQPIHGAKLSPYVNFLQVPAYENGFKTDANGIAKLPIPVNMPGGERANYFEIPVDASNYVERTVRWACNTGMVMSVVSSEHTVELSQGITLSGTVMDDEGRPLAGLRVGAVGFGLIGNDAVVQQVDYNSYSVPAEKSPVMTDAAGHFTIENYPADVRALGLDFLEPDGSLYKFQTPEGFSIHAETLPKVSLSELKAGAARIVIPRGVTVQGDVVKNDGTPVAGAEVVEVVERGNAIVLSRNKTDSSGHFSLSNRPLHQIILGVSKDGCASLSTVVTIQPGMEPMHLVLSPEMPLRGQIVNEAGLPMPSAGVRFVDVFNPGQFSQWGDETGPDGRFEWTDAPTNEVAVIAEAQGYAPHLVRLRASTNNNFITLHTGDNETIHVTGHVSDADSGTPIDPFQVRIGHYNWGYMPEGKPRNFERTKGEMDFKIPRKDFPVGTEEVWRITVEADGYDTDESRSYYLEEGDQRLDIKLKRGGTVEGVVRTPSGQRAAGAQLALTWGHPIVSVAPGELQSWSAADANGAFKLEKQVPGSNILVIFHESGWAMVPIMAGLQKGDVTLTPWSRLEGTLTLGQQPLPNQDIEVKNPRPYFRDPIMIVYRTKTGSDGNFVIDKLPAGDYKVGCLEGRWGTTAMQTCFSLAAGETKTIELTASGPTITARLQAPPGWSAVNWSNALAVLNTDVQVPSEPAQNEYVDTQALRVAREKYNHDPAVLAAMAQRRTFVGAVNSDGLATFQQVPPGNYLLEVKVFDTNHQPPQPNFDQDPGVIVASLQTSVTVPDTNTVPTGDSSVTLGDFALDAP